MSHPKQVFEMLEDLGLPADVIKWCIFPYAYQNTNQMRKKYKRQHKELMKQIILVKRPFVNYFDNKVLKDKWVQVGRSNVYDYVIVEQIWFRVFKYNETIKEVVKWANR